MLRAAYARDTDWGPPGPGPRHRATQPVSWPSVPVALAGAHGPGPGPSNLTLTFKLSLRTVLPDSEGPGHGEVPASGGITTVLQGLLLSG